MPINAHRALRALAVTLFLACFFWRYGQPPIADEVDFMKPIEAWLTQGPQRDGLWHAPYYPWFLSLVGRAFGFSPGPFRMIGLLTALFTVACMVAAARHLTARIPAWKVTTIAVLGLLMPPALGSALMLDYDTTLLVAATALYFCMIATFELPKRNELLKHATWFGVALAGCLMAKETTPLVYPIGLVALWWSRFGAARAIGYATLSGVIGVTVFLGITQLWFWHYKLPLSLMFELDYLCLVRRVGSELDLVRSVWVRTSHYLWLGLPLTALFFLSLIRLVKAGGAIRAITVIVLTTLFFYTFVLTQMTFHFPKYMAPILPWMMWLLVMAEPGELRASAKACAAWLIPIVLWFLLVQDPLGILYGRSAREVSSAIVPYIVPLIGWAVLRINGRRLGVHFVPRLSLFCLMLTAGLSIAYAKSTLTSKSSVTYWYGERTIEEARAVVARWRAANPMGEIYSPSKDIAFNTREHGTQFVSMDALFRVGSKLCGQKRPLLIVTRARDESSLLKAPQLAPYKECLKHQGQGADIAFAASRAGF